MWFECTECVFATNSPTQAERHTSNTTHIIDSDQEEI